MIDFKRQFTQCNITLIAASLKEYHDNEPKNFLVKWTYSAFITFMGLMACIISKVQLQLKP